MLARVAPWLVALLATAPCDLAAAPAGWVELPALAPIAALLDPTDAVLARGTRDGLLGCQLAPVHPLRLDAKKQGHYDDQNILAWAGCAPRTPIDDSKTTRVTLRGAAVKLEVGDVVAWRWAVPAELSNEPLVRLLALGLEPLAVNDRSPLATLAELHKQPRLDEVERLVGALVAESHGGAALARDFYAAARAKGGRHGGALLAEALARTTAADVRDFLHYAAIHRETYAGRKFLWLDIYATWLTNGAPSGAAQGRADRAMRLQKQVQDALRQGAPEKAATLLQELKGVDPDDRFVAPTMRKLARLSNLRSRIDDDPSDEALQQQLAIHLGEMGMLAAADEAWQRLLELKPDHRNAVAQRAQLAERLGRWPQAAALWQQAHAKKAVYARAIARSQRVRQALDLPSDATLALQAAEELAAQDTDRQTELLMVLLRRCRLHSSGPAQVRSAWSMEQVEVGRLGRDDAKRATALAIASYDYPEARRRLDHLASLCERDKAALREALTELVDTAMACGALRMADELAQRWRKLRPDDIHALTFIGVLRMVQRRPVDALSMVDAVLGKDPQEGFAYWMRLRLLTTLGRTAEARASAERLLQVDERSLMALVSSARVAVAEGRYPDAVQKMGKAWARAFTQATTGTSELEERAAVEMAAQSAAQLKARPTDHASRLRLVRALLQLDLVPQAQAHWQQLPKGSEFWREAAALLGDNTSVPAEQAVPWLQAGQDGSLLRKQALTSALAWVAVDKAPDDPKALLQFAAALVPQAQFGDALDALAWAREQPGVDEALLAQIEATQALAQSGRDARAYLQRATAAVDHNDYVEAIAACRAALRDFQAIGALQEAARAAGRLASTCDQAGDETCALQAARQAVAIAELLGDRDDVLIRGEVLAQIQVRQGNLAAWEPALAALERMTEGQGLLGHLADVILHRTWLARQEGRAQAAVGLARRARQLAERGGRPKTHRRAMLEEANALADAAQLPEALTVATELLRAARDANDSDRKYAVLQLLINLAWQQEDSALTEHWLAVAEQTARQADNPSFSADLQLVRAEWLLLGQARPKAALAELEGLPVRLRKAGSHADEVNALVLQARALLAVDLPDAATKVAAVAEKRALALSRVVPAAQAARLFALASRPGAPEALPAAQRAVAAARKLDVPGLLPLALHAEAIVHQRGGAPAAAALPFAGAVQALVAQAEGATQRQVGVGVRRELDRVWADAIAAELAAGRAERAQQWTALSRAVQARQSRGLASGSSDGDPLLRAYSQAQQQRTAALQSARGVASSREQAAWRDRAAESARTAAALLDKMRREHRKLWTQVAVEPESLAAVLPRLPRNTLIVQYFATATHLHAFVAGGGQPGTRVVSVPVPWSRVESAVAHWRQAVVGKADRVATRGAEAFGLDLPVAATVAALDERAASEALYGWLLAPLQTELAKADQVLVVPFGALHYLPLHALARWDAKGQPRYALEDLRIGYLSATTATAIGDRARTPGHRLRVLGLGNPDGTLPGARMELERVAGRLPAGSQLFFGSDATAKRFLGLAPAFDVLHIATHGVLRPDPADSHLKMADGPLTLATISGARGLDQRPRLVVLSACSTALEAGKAPGDEISSLSTAFAVAGVPSLLASLWDVDDDATAELIAQFYTALVARDAVDTLEALRRAQLHVLRLGRQGRPGWQSPAAWAAMHLVGDPR